MPALFSECHAQVSLHCLISKFERKQEMQSADYKKRFREDQRLYGNGHPSGVFCRGSTMGPREWGEWLHGQCRCQNLAQEAKGQGWGRECEPGNLTWVLGRTEAQKRMREEVREKWGGAQRSRTGFKDGARSNIIAALAWSLRHTASSKISHGKERGVGTSSQKINFPSSFPGEVTSVLVLKTKLGRVSDTTQTRKPDHRAPAWPAY